MHFEIILIVSFYYREPTVKNIYFLNNCFCEKYVEKKIDFGT